MSDAAAILYGTSDAATRSTSVPVETGPIDAAARLYGNAQAATPADAPEPQSTLDRAAETLYGPEPGDETPSADGNTDTVIAIELTDEIKALREDPARLVDPDVDKAIKDEAYVELLGEEQGRLVAAEMREICQDLCLQPDDLTEIGMAVQAAHEAPFTFAQRDQMQAEGIALVHEHYGPKTGEAIAAAKALAARDPRVKQFLNNTGVGDHPQVILRFARAGMTARNRGLLK